MWNRSSFWNKLCLLLLILPPFLFSCTSGRTGEGSENTVTFTDALGREVTAERSPERTAALLGSFADVWMLSGGELCGAAEDAWEDFGLNLPNAVNLGGAHSPSLEALLAADPELVLASASTSSHVSLCEVLESAGITVAYFDVDSFSDYLAMLDICTDLTGRKDLYEQNGLSVRHRIEEIKAEYEKTGPSEKERTVLLLRTSSGSVKAKGSRGTILGEMLCDLGCINIADSDTALLETLSVEQVILRDPHRILVVTMGDEEAALANLSRMMEENPAWGTLTAVKEGRLHLMDSDLFNRKPNADWARSYEVLCEILGQ